MLVKIYRLGDFTNSISHVRHVQRNRIKYRKPFSPFFLIAANLNPIFKMSINVDKCRCFLMENHRRSLHRTFPKQFSSRKSAPCWNKFPYERSSERYTAPPGVFRALLEKSLGSFQSKCQLVPRRGSRGVFRTKKLSRFGILATALLTYFRHISLYFPPQGPCLPERAPPLLLSRMDPKHPHAKMFHT